MKRFVLAFTVLAGCPTFAGEINSVFCEATKKAKVQDFESRIYVELKGLMFNDDTASIKSFVMNITNLNARLYDVVPMVEATTWTGEDVANVEYNGIKYKNHRKFPLVDGDKSKSIGNLEADRADLIISPAYTVVKTIHKQNLWDKTWTWDVEVRKHSAVLDLSFNDHHGDYVKLNCFSTGEVNNSRARR